MGWPLAQPIDMDVLDAESSMLARVARKKLEPGGAF